MCVCGENPETFCAVRASSKNCTVSSFPANTGIPLHYRYRHVFKRLYVQCVRPHLEFASVAWSQWLEADKAVLVKIQQKAVSMISSLKGANFEES